MTVTVTTKEKVIKYTLGKTFTICLDFDFFKHPAYLYWLKEDLIVKLELNSFEKVTLCSGNTVATYNLSDISLEYDERYATTIDVFYDETTWIPYAKATSFHYQTLCKKDNTSMIDINNLSVCLFVLFLDKHDDFPSKNKEFYNPSIKKILTKMTCLISFLQQTYKLETFTLS